tara:strand:+ start:165 stop:290 length:126 start_codon:yes stop_codon:yes gene_type:complete
MTVALPTLKEAKLALSRRLFGGGLIEMRGEQCGQAVLQSTK